MPAPTTIDELLDLVRKSGVVDEKRLSAHMDKLRASNSLPSEPIKLATKLIQDGLLTHFQADQFLQGKWRRFQLGKYKVLERLGSGGMGSVYLCEHIMMRRRVAVKVLPPGKAEDSSSLERFYREARAVAALDHPNIVRAYDIDQEENLHFLVMEHVDGASLQEIIKRAGPMEVLRAAHYMRQAALGLQHAHETAGLIHRDIKPGNILVDRNGIVKVLDMGLARFFYDEDDQLTKKHDESVLGTADYLAPEQALDSHSVDIRADIYSLGGTFYYCLTGKTPFAEGSVAQKLIWHQTRQPKPIRGFRPEVPEGIIAIIDRMMAKDPSERYQTPQEAADALAPWTQTPIPPPPDNEMPQFSLAATPKSLVGEASMSSSKPPSDVPLSPLPRKPWQVSGGAATATAPAPVAKQPAAPAPAVRPAAVPASPPPAKSPAPVPSPKPAVNHAKRPGSVPAMELPDPPEANRPGAATPKPTETKSGPIPVAREEVKPAPESVEESADEEIPEFEQGGVAAAAIRRKRAGVPDRPRGKGPGKALLFGAGGVVLALGIVFGIFLIVSSRGNGKSRIAPPPPRKPIVVGPAGLGSALRAARSGDRLILQGDLLETDVTVVTPDITIEGEEGKTVVWKCPASGTDGITKLLSIQAASGVTIKNITFDGSNRTGALLMLFARCPGTRLENLTFRNTGKGKDAILIANCTGDEGKRISFEGLRFQTSPGQNAIHFRIFDHAKSILTNRHFNIHGCTFDGEGRKVAVTPGNEKEVPPVDRDTIELPSGVAFEMLPRPK